MAINLLSVSNKYQHFDCNYDSRINNNDDNNNNNVTINRLVSKFSDIVIPRNIKNLQNVSIPLEFPLEHLKQSAVNIYSLSEQIEFLNSTSSIDDESEDTISGVFVSQSIENTLKDVRAEDVSESCVGEMVIPADLSSRVAEDIIKMAEDEPCGLRGCIIYIGVEDRSAAACKDNGGGVRRLGKVRCDSTAVPTFEVTLILKQDCSWLRLLPLKGCWKKLKNKSLVLSSSYSLTKNKLYRSN